MIAVLIVAHPKAGFTITAVTFNPRYLLLNCSQPGAYFGLHARCRFLDAEAPVRGDSVGEP